MKKLLLSLILTQGLIAAPIHDAVINDDIALVRHLIENGHDINAKNEDGKTPLNIAYEIYVDHENRDEFYSNEMIFFISQNGASEIHDAILQNNIDQLKEFIKNGADVNAEGEKPGASTFTPLIMAVVYNNRNMVDILINNGADINHVCPNGETALSVACDRDVEEMVELFLNLGANPNSVTDYEGFTSLHEANFCGCLKIVKLLLNNPWCNHLIRDSYGNTPEQHAREQVKSINNNQDIDEDLIDNAKDLVGNDITDDESLISDYCMIIKMLKNAPSVKQKMVNLEHGGLTRFAAIAARNISDEEYEMTSKDIGNLIYNAHLKYMD